MRQTLDTMFDFSKLRGRIIEKYRTLGNFASAAGITLNTLSSKLGSARGIGPDEVIKWSALLEIDTSEIGTYFFTLKVNEV